jgi:glycosyltransferase involved in cell wall biosynthesis
MPRARLAMIYGSEDLLPGLDRWLAENPSTQARVRLLGLQPHRALEAFYNSSEFFLLGSHHEGSGFAVLEALACGVVPVLSDIPSFRVLTGRGGIGGLWPVGDAEALATVLTARYSRLHGRTPDEVRAFFDEHFSWEAIGRRGMAVYREIIDGRRGRSHS